MRRIMAASGFAMLLAVGHRALPQNGPARARELAPGVFYWQGDVQARTQTNVGWVVFDEYVFVVDANFPWGAREILPEIRRTSGKPVRFLFNTHYHADHAAGNGVFREEGAAVVSTEDCAEESRRKGPRDTANQAGERAEPMVHPTVLFERRMEFDDGHHRVELIRVGPAHTKGDAVAYLPKEGILFVGDLAVNWTRGNNVGDPDADYANWIRALDRLAEWKARVVVPAHGELGSVDTLRGQRSYLAEMLEKVEEGLRAGRTADEVAGAMDLSKHRPFGTDRARTASQARTMFRTMERNR